MLKRVAPFVAFAALVAVPASAQLRVAELEDIHESYNDCFAVTDSGSLDTDALVDAGWERATMSDGDGNALEGGPLVFGHSDRAPIIMLSGLEGEGICVVIARIENLAAYETFKSAWKGRLPKPDEEGQIFYRAQGRAVQMALTGSPQEPGLRLVVATPGETE